MYLISGKNVTEVVKTTFSEIGLFEVDIEELLRKNIDMLLSDEESMLIVGQQVRNEQHGISDLTAIDQDGNIVLIEIKRDLADITTRKEPFEFQAIRYAASYATIKDPEDLITKIYAPYIEKHKAEYKIGDLTSTEIADRQLSNFLKENRVGHDFNVRQRIILVASDYDEQTLSAVAWLNSNQVDISCYKLIPYKNNEDILINIEKVLPLGSYDDYYVNFLEKTSRASVRKSGITRRTLPTIHNMLEWGVVKEGDIIVAKDRNEEAQLLSTGNVLVNNEEMSMQKWLKGDSAGLAYRHIPIPFIKN